MKHTSTLLMLTLGLCTPALADDTTTTNPVKIEPIPEETFLQKINRLERFLERNAVRGRRGKDPAGHRYRIVRPKMSDAILAEQMTGDLSYPEPKIERRRYPKQRINGALTPAGDKPRFAAKETILDFGNGLKVRRMTFPNAQVAQDWAGADIARNRSVDPKNKGAKLHSGKPRVMEIRGDSAVLIEGDKALDSNIAAHALYAAWEHEAKPGASKQHTSLFSVDDGKGKVARMTDNRVVRARIFPNAPIQKDLPEGMPIFEVAGDARQLDKVFRLFNALSPTKIQRHDQPQPTLAKPLETKKTGAKQKLEGSLGTGK